MWTFMSGLKNDMQRQKSALTLLIRVSATVTVYRGHRRILFILPEITSLFIVCVEIIAAIRRCFGFL